MVDFAGKWYFSTVLMWCYGLLGHVINQDIHNWYLAYAFFGIWLMPFLVFGSCLFWIWFMPFWNLAHAFFGIWFMPFWDLAHAFLKFGSCFFWYLVHAFLGFGSCLFGIWLMPINSERLLSVQLRYLDKPALRSVP